MWYIGSLNSFYHTKVCPLGRVCTPLSVSQYDSQIISTKVFKIGGTSLAGSWLAMGWLSSQPISCYRLPAKMIISLLTLSIQFYPHAHLKISMVLLHLPLSLFLPQLPICIFIKTNMLSWVFNSNRCFYWFRCCIASRKEIHVVFRYWRVWRNKWGGWFVWWWLTGRRKEEEAEHGAGENTWEEFWVG